MEYWGYHLILDVGGCDSTLMQDKQNVYNWICKLVQDIKMQPIGEPIIKYTAADHIDKAGFTAIQVIVTSSIVAHFIDSSRQIYVDVFSCKQFDTSIVKDSIIDSFAAKSIREFYLTRQAD